MPTNQRGEEQKKTRPELIQARIPNMQATSRDRDESIGKKKLKSNYKQIQCKMMTFKIRSIKKRIKKNTKQTKRVNLTS
jgi:mRNA-degrading endonuclease toxin of MazEF toxin-antitoxin module